MQLPTTLANEGAVMHFCRIISVFFVTCSFSNNRLEVGSGADCMSARCDECGGDGLFCDSCVQGVMSVVVAGVRLCVQFVMSVVVMGCCVMHACKV